ncbi:MAG: hypothetical protein BWY74_00341 [Firmicutes bacterium ADurb.Bin419]|nr:MAG: hypothetical protein BWY74_00341 [Firmicutes bacterium ADurb.Bin419]
MNARQKRYFIRHNLSLYIAIVLALLSFIGIVILISVVSAPRLKEYNRHMCVDVYGLNEHCNKINK